MKCWKFDRIVFVGTMYDYVAPQRIKLKKHTSWHKPGHPYKRIISREYRKFLNRRFKRYSGFSVFQFTLVKKEMAGIV